MKPKVDWELLERHHEGLIVTTGCLGGVVLQALLNGRRGRGSKRRPGFRTSSGATTCSSSSRTTASPEQHLTNPALVGIARQIGAPLLATNDSHYTAPRGPRGPRRPAVRADRRADDDPDRFKFHGDRALPEDGGEMRRLFSELPEACDNTLLDRRAGRRRDRVRQATSCPTSPYPRVQGRTYEERPTPTSPPHLRGARERYGAPLPREVSERLAYELGVIAGMGFSPTS